MPTTQLMKEIHYHCEQIAGLMEKLSAQGITTDIEFSKVDFSAMGDTFKKYTYIPNVGFKKEELLIFSEERKTDNG